jgi:uncharacterized membrane protein
MTDSTVWERFKQNASGIAATVVTGTWLAALLLNVEWWLPLMLFGYIVIVPVVAMLFDEDDEEEQEGEIKSDSTSRTAETARTPLDAERSEDVGDALERLRARYAEGDLTDEQFDRKLDRLLATETPEDAAEYARRDRATERETEYEQ